MCASLCVCVCVLACVCAHVFTVSACVHVFTMKVALTFAEHQTICSCHLCSKQSGTRSPPVSQAVNRQVRYGAPIHYMRIRMYMHDCMYICACMHIRTCVLFRPNMKLSGAPSRPVPQAFKIQAIQICALVSMIFFMLMYVRKCMCICMFVRMHVCTYICM